MFWSFSFQMLPDEEIIEDSTQKQLAGLKPAYSVFLTNKRAIFRFDGFGSSLTQSFFYNEIIDVKPCKRLFVDYLHVKTKKKDFFLNTANADYWSNKILSIKGNLKESPEDSRQMRPVSPEREKRELLDMITALRNNSLLSDKEFEEKIHLLDSMKF